MKEDGSQDLRARTKAFALRIIKLYTALPQNSVSQVLGKQVLRSGTSVGAHYYGACRAKSDADFINKIEGGLQELDETIYWLELISEAGIFTEERLKPLHDEASELTAIFVTIAKNVKSRNEKAMQ